MNVVVARFAPSTTVFLHIGGIRTALINYIFVQQSKKENSNSKLLLRLEDTDITRSKDEYKKSILDGLEWMGIKWDGKFQTQSERIKRHKEIAYKLLEKGHAYKCICTKEDLDAKRIENKEEPKEETKEESKVQKAIPNFDIREVLHPVPNTDEVTI